MSEGKPKGTGVVTHPDVDTVLRHTQQKCGEFIDCLTIDAEVVRDAMGMMPAGVVEDAARSARLLRAALRDVREAKARDAA